MADLLVPGLFLGLGAAGLAQGVPVGVIALGAGIAAVGVVLPGRASDGRHAWWAGPLGLACTMTGSWILVAAAIGQWEGDLLRAIAFGLGAALIATLWDRFDERRPGRARPLRSQDDFGPVRGRVQAWWDRESYRGAQQRRVER